MSKPGVSLRANPGDRLVCSSSCGNDPSRPISCWSPAKGRSSITKPRLLGLILVYLIGMEVLSNPKINLFPTTSTNQSLQRPRPSKCVLEDAHPCAVQREDINHFIVAPRMMTTRHLPFLLSTIPFWGGWFVGLAHCNRYAVIPLGANPSWGYKVMQPQINLVTKS